MPNIQFTCPHCQHSMEAPIDMLGQLTDCPECGETIEVQKSPPKPPALPSPLPRAVPKLKLPKPPSIARKLVRAREYKVLTQGDKFFAGEFTPEKLEAAMNAYAAHGWHVISVTTVRFPTVPDGSREELIVVMGRDK